MLEDENQPYKGLKVDMLELLDIHDQEIWRTLTDFQVGQMVRRRFHSMKIDNEKFQNALRDEVKRGTGCSVCYYTGFEMGFTGWGSQLNPARACSYCDGTAADG